MGLSRFHDQQAYEFIAILAAEPHAAIRFVLRNFNNPLLVTGIGFEDGRCGNGEVELLHVFPALREWMEKNLVNGTIPFRAFLADAQEIANILRREVRITHQWGSGKPDHAEFKDYGPFLPKQ